MRIAVVFLMAALISCCRGKNQNAISMTNNPEIMGCHQEEQTPAGSWWQKAIYETAKLYAEENNSPY